MTQMDLKAENYYLGDGHNRKFIDYFIRFFGLFSWIYHRTNRKRKKAGIYKEKQIGC